MYFDTEELSPGVRNLVIWLNENGHETTDSGDGSNYKEGMEGAMPIPMVIIHTTKEDMIDSVGVLRKDLEELGVKFGKESDLPLEEAPNIEVSYSPIDGETFILLTNVTSEVAGLEESIEIHRNKALTVPEHKLVAAILEKASFRMDGGSMYNWLTCDFCEVQANEGDTLVHASDCRAETILKKFGVG